MHLLQFQFPSTTLFSKPSLSLVRRPPPILFTTTQLKQFPIPRFSIQSFKCSASSAVSERTTQLELAQNHDCNKPSPAEVSRTTMELSSMGTLSTVNPDGWPLGIGVRFAVDSQGTPIICLHQSSNTVSFLNNDVPASLHVQLEQCGLRTPQCTILGKLTKIEDKMTSKKHCSLWKRKFGEEANEDLIYAVSVERVLHMEDFGEDGVWVMSMDYEMASPDPLRDFAESFVEEINANNGEDVYRFCNIYADLDFQVLDAKVVWVDRLGFDIRVRTSQDDAFEVRIPFPGEVSDEKGAKSSFNCMSQLAWEVEKNFHVPDFEKVKQVKKIVSRSR
ncbi:OLC1v1024677C1 [Oldenlandia corymbosa var. corymbosa]|uniref:OLC1v1024677C1 n=1 Tax=Oldenlandia corymbosa var. corymbosa TaxID=529605 RepID=A0AAV1C4B0_OLDCO|nr:OLC1v1024677C1 [Oldenlandia corymbosa var. corymbosa]